MAEPKTPPRAASVPAQSVCDSLYNTLAERLPRPAALASALRDGDAALARSSAGKVAFFVRRGCAHRAEVDRALARHWRSVGVIWTIMLVGAMAVAWLALDWLVSPAAMPWIQTLAGPLLPAIAFKLLLLLAVAAAYEDLVFGAEPRIMAALLAAFAVSALSVTFMPPGSLLQEAARWSVLAVPLLAVARAIQRLLRWLGPRGSSRNR